MPLSAFVRVRPRLISGKVIGSPGIHYAHRRCRGMIGPITFGDKCITTRSRLCSCATPYACRLPSAALCNCCVHSCASHAAHTSIVDGLAFAPTAAPWQRKLGWHARSKVPCGSPRNGWRIRSGTSYGNRGKATGWERSSRGRIARDDHTTDWLRSRAPFRVHHLCGSLCCVA